jgi:formamidopyrimidine-DNA glycosylase
MPELPEVELVVRHLNQLVSGRRIAAAELRRQRLAPDTTPNKFARLLAGSAINFVGRRGKHVLFDLDNRSTLITHLRMSGRFLLLNADDEDPKFTHSVFHFEDGSRLVFQDQRHFGLMKVVKTSELREAKELKKLAPEPFSDDFTAEYLRRVLRTTRRSLKEFLLDQTKVCGLGNIYASEALFLAGIHPAKRASLLSKARAHILFEKIRDVLREAIDSFSTPNADPNNPEIGYYGERYESYWRVYDRAQMPCPVCQTLILKLKQGGRSSYFCPKCQKK